MAVHGIRFRDSVAGAGATQAAVHLDGVHRLHSVSLQNEDVLAAENAIIMLQFGTDVYDADREFHPLAIGTSRAGAPLLWADGFTVRGQVLVVGQITHAGADVHRLTVLAWKVRDR